MTKSTTNSFPIVSKAEKERTFRSEQQEQQLDRCWLPENPFIRHQVALSRRQSIFRRAKTKSLRISFIIVLAFVICWAPYYFMMITFIFLNPDDKVEFTFSILKLLKRFQKQVTRPVDLFEQVVGCKIQISEYLYRVNQLIDIDWKLNLKTLNHLYVQ